MNNDLTIQIQNIKNNEVVSLTLNHKAKNRYEELCRVLTPFDMYFGGEIELYDFATDNEVAKLISNSDELTDWLDNDVEY